MQPCLIASTYKSHDQQTQPVCQLLIIVVQAHHRCMFVAMLALFTGLPLASHSLHTIDVIFLLFLLLLRDA